MQLKYELYCKYLSRMIAKKRMNPKLIPTYLFNRKDFLKIQGIKFVNGQMLINRKGALRRLGRKFCDKCFENALIETGVYILDQGEIKLKKEV